MVLKLKTRDLLRDFRKYRKMLTGGQIDKIVIESISKLPSLEIKLTEPQKTDAKKILDYCKALTPEKKIERVKLNIFDNFIKD